MNRNIEPKLFLKKNVFICLTDDTLVFLNLRNDSYSCLEPQHTQSVTALLGLPSRPAQTKTYNAQAASEDTTKIIRDLINNGLATQSSNEGKRAEFINQSSELKEMLGYEIGKTPKINAIHLFNFFRAFIIAKLLRRFGSIEHTVTRVRRRKEKKFNSKRKEVTEEKINELVEIYKVLKPLFVTVKNECVFNSLFLIEFLACYRVYPDWYFGVRLNEFYAHCWVQSNNTIYDDSIASTSLNQPIMAV